MGRRFVRAVYGSVSMEARLEQLQDPIQEQRMPATCYIYNQDALNSDCYGIDIDFSPINREIWLSFILLYILCNPNQAIDDYYDHLEEYILKFLKRLDLNESSFLNILDWCTSYTEIYMRRYKDEKEREKTKGYVRVMLVKGFTRLILRNFLKSINVDLRM